MNIRKRFIAVALLVFACAELGAEGGVSVDSQIVTDYVFRGESLLNNYFIQEHKAYSSFKPAFAYQPSITYTTPVDGLSFNLWGSFALTKRADADVDGSLQYGPGTPDLLTTPDPGNGGTPVITSTGVNPNAGAILTQIFNYPTQLINAVGFDTYFSTFNYRGGTAGYYNEENGLARADEVDLTIDYTKGSSIGDISFGIVQYSFASLGAKGDATFYTEMYTKYAPKFAPGVTLALYSDIQSSNYYWNLSYGSDMELSKAMALDYSVALGYGQRQNLQGIQDVTGHVGVTSGAFSAGINAAYRPDYRLIETTDPNTSLPLWVNGGSTAADGLVEDPSKNTGIMNTLINGIIGSTLQQGTALPYTYTPRTKLPRVLVWLNFGYSVEL